MKKINYNTIGNLEYIHEPRTVKPEGLIINNHNNLILKLYSMSKNSHPSEKAIVDTKELVDKKIYLGEIKPLSGLGFTILSEDMLNVAIWDNEYPTVLKNQVYCFKEDINSIKQLDIREIGSFCAWELGIVGHERNAWIKFLNSNRTNGDKQKYLEDFIEGELK